MPDPKYNTPDDIAKFMEDFLTGKNPGFTEFQFGSDGVTQEELNAAIRKGEQAANEKRGKGGKGG